jgi:hypothetical protein
MKTLDKSITTNYKRLSSLGLSRIALIKLVNELSRENDQLNQSISNTIEDNMTDRAELYR